MAILGQQALKPLMASVVGSWAAPLPGSAPLLPPPEGWSAEFNEAGAMHVFVHGESVVQLYHKYGDYNGCTVEMFFSGQIRIHMEGLPAYEGTYKTLERFAHAGYWGAPPEFVADVGGEKADRKKK